jgi:hypothetical protein
MDASIRAVGYVAALALGSAYVQAQLSPNAPHDQPRALKKEDLAENDKVLAPYIKATRETYPAARARFLAGLPPGEHFFVVTRLFDSERHWEQVFVRVQTIEGGLITGVISSQIMIVSGFRAGQAYTFKESALMDWLISKADGSEEGNVVGKFQDTLKR